MTLQGKIVRPVLRGRIDGPAVPTGWLKFTSLVELRATDGVVESQLRQLIAGDGSHIAWYEWDGDSWEQCSIAGDPPAFPDVPTLEAALSDGQVGTVGVVLYRMVGESAVRQFDEGDVNSYVDPAAMLAALSAGQFGTIGGFPYQIIDGAARELVVRTMFTADILQRTLAQSTTEAFATVTGTIAIWSITPIVMVQIQNQPNLLDFWAVPTIGAPKALCTPLDIANNTVGTFYGMTGTQADALQRAVSGALEDQKIAQKVADGFLSWKFTASSSGEMLLAVDWTAVTPGATLTQIAP